MKVTQNLIPGANPHSTELNKTLGTEKTTDKTVGKARAPQSPEVTAANTSGANVEISEGARMMQRAAEVAAAAPDLRKDRVAQLKKSIGDGTYQVDSSAVAERLVEDHLGTHFGKNEL